MKIKSLAQKALMSFGCIPKPIVKYVHSPTPLENCFDALVRLGFTPQCLVDVGANHGSWTRTALRFFPEMEVLMIEPQEWLRNDVADLIETNPRLRWVTAGASNKDDTLLLTITPRDDSCNFLLSAKSAAKQGLRQIEVPVTTVYSLVQKFRMLSPDIIKIDAEGLDLEVLEGCGPFLGTSDLFFVEVSMLQNVRENSFMTVFGFMKNHGYALFDVTDLNRSPKCGALCLMELAFVREGSDLQAQAKW
jgi:FkbM family methyltransferase